MGSDRPKVNAEKVYSVLSESVWAQKLYNEMMRDLVIFGTTHPYIYKKATLWERFKWRLLAYKVRARDAWLVLTGRAHIADDYDD
jgi:hypothetical protein